MIKKGLSNIKSTRPALTKTIIFLCIFLPLAAVAQPAAEPVSEGSDYFVRNMQYIVIGLLILILMIFLFGMMVMGDKLVKIAARKLNQDKGISENDAEEKYHFFPSFFPDFSREDGEHKIYEIKKGMNLHIKGEAEKVIQDYDASSYAVRPISFKAMSPIPKLYVQIGDEVKAGDPLFFDKKRPEIIYTAPVSGEVIEVRRGDKRMITDVVILADKEIKFKEFGAADPNTMDRQQIIDRMLQSGAWPFVRQRPFDIVADPNDSPKMIYISCFDTSPLAPDYDLIADGHGAEFQAGLNALKKLTDNEVHLGLSADRMPSHVFLDAEGVQKHWFMGPHPAGNIGIQIHHVDPINKGDIVWYLNPQDVIILGRLFTEGRYNTQKIVALGGPEVIAPKYYRTYQGASIGNMVKDNLKTDHVRYISGNVLTGSQIPASGFMGFYDNLVSVILEGDQPEFMGWIAPSYPRPSINPTFLSYYYEGEEHRVNTNAHGEERAFVVTGLYERVLPMDIYPIPLMKAILAQDFEKMEGLGIYEVSEEDFALCEFVCPSKIDIQSIIGNGLELIRTQG